MHNFTVSNDPLMFDGVDYVLFFTLLGSSAVIGIYFALFRKQDTTADYLLGGKTMGIFPVSMSLIASMISGITLMGVPSDIYRNGATFLWSNVSIPAVCLAIAYVYMPVFYNLQLTTSYEYLKLRFDSTIRIFASLLFVIMTILYVPIVIYIPALAFAHVSGLNLNFITLLICAICILYTCLGGIRAVVWTDTLQILVMVGSVFLITFLGFSEAGGLKRVLDVAAAGQRLDLFVMNPDPTMRDSFFTIIIGFTVTWVCFAGVNQGTVQRFLSLPTLRDVRISLFIFAVGVCIFHTVAILNGLIMHSLYADCDPITLGVVQRPDQLMPYHVMNVAKGIPGLPGLFIAGVVSAALSTLSTVLNSLSGVIYEDFVAPFMPKQTTEKTASNVMKLFVIIIGLICTCLVFVVQYLGTAVFQLSISVSGVTSGPLLGLFTMGMLFPSANKHGALFGGIASLLFLSWIVIGAQVHTALGHIKHDHKPVSVENCTFATNFTSPFNIVPENVIAEDDRPLFMYRISMFYYALLGASVVILIGLPVSWLTKKKEDPEVSKDLISPIMHWYMSKNTKMGSKTKMAIGL